MKVSENTAISMPVRNLLSIIFAVGVGVWAYFGIVERLNIIETELQLMQADLLKAAEQKPIDQEQYMLLEFLSKEHDKLKDDVEDKWTKQELVEKGIYAKFELLMRMDNKKELIRVLNQIKEKENFKKLEQCLMYLVKGAK